MPVLKQIEPVYFTAMLLTEICGFIFPALPKEIAKDDK